MTVSLVLFLQSRLDRHLETLDTVGWHLETLDIVGYHLEIMDTVGRIWRHGTLHTTVYRLVYGTELDWYLVTLDFV
jgi:hypothetical protein